MPPPPRQPTTREIAAACGFSQSAVSHALRGNSQVSASTRRKVLAAARRLGWRPNPLASAYMAHLRSTRRVSSSFRATLGLLIPGPFGGKVRDQLGHLQHYYEGASERAKASGYGLQTFGIDDPDMTARRLGSILTSRGVSGLIIPGLHSPVLDGLDWRNFTAVTLAYATASSRHHRVAVDAFGGFAETFLRLRDLGYSRIGVVVADSYDALHNHGVLFPAYYMRDELAGRCRIEIHRFKEASDLELTRIQSWLTKVRPEVVLGHEVAYRAIQGLGWRVPKDVAYASVDRAPEYPQIGGFDQRHALRGAVAAELLIGQVVQNDRGFPAVPRVVFVPGAWAEGASVPRAERR